MYRKTESFKKKHTLSFSDTYSLNSYVIFCLIKKNIILLYSEY